MCVTERDAHPSAASDAVSQLYQLSKKISKKYSRFCLEPPRGQVQLSRTAENLHAYLETRAPTLSLGIAIQSVIGFVRIRTGDPFGVLGELRTPGLFEPLHHYFRWCRFDGWKAKEWSYIQRYVRLVSMGM